MDFGQMLQDAEAMKRFGQTVVLWNLHTRQPRKVFQVPGAPKQIYEKVIGKQLNMPSQSWNGERVYFSSSLLANWDKKGEDDDQFLKGYEKVWRKTVSAAGKRIAVA